MRMRNYSSVPNNSLFDRKDNQNSYASASFHDIFYRRRQFSPIPRHKERTTLKSLRTLKTLNPLSPRKTTQPRNEFSCGAEYQKQCRS